MGDSTQLHGWTAVPRDASIILSTRDDVKAPKSSSVREITLPSTPLADAVTQYAKQELDEQTFNHSMRVYYYGQAIRHDHFPSWQFSDETYFLACLLHDIGTTDQNLHATLLSFEFYGGMLALNLLKDELRAPKEQAESVTEAIIRHQDLGESGKITVLGQLLQLATVFGMILLTIGAIKDNMGLHADLVHKDTIEDVVKHYPRKGWSGCFAATIRKENALKPWAHTTKLGEEEFPSGVEGNELMAPYD